MIYLDNAATTKPDPSVVAGMIPILYDTYGNPGSIHTAGSEAEQVLHRARQSAAAFLGCQPSQVIFTSGGSEGNSMVFSGILPYLQRLGRTKLVVSAAEHDSVLGAAYAAAESGFDLCVLPVDKEGCVSLRVLQSVLDDNTGLVSVMYVNNELGGVNDVRSIAEVCRSHGVLFHTDCVQAAGLLPLDMTAIGCDFATVSAHKFHGPKGVGAVFVKDKELLEPLICGGEEQEFGLRGGTENVPGICGMGLACDLANLHLNDEQQSASTAKQTFFTTLSDRLRLAGLDDLMAVNGPPVIHPGRILNLRFSGIDGQTLVLALSAAGVCISAGSACSAHSNFPSHVLTAIGLSDDEARSSVRISFSRDTTNLEAKAAACAMADCVETLHAAVISQ